MTSLCPKGHRSASPDYCDVCGVRLTAPSTAPPAAAPDDLDTAAAAALEPCPVCGTPRSHDDLFCEECGANFVTAPPTAGDEPAAAPAAGWEAIVSVDRRRFERYSSAGLSLPDRQSEWRVSLDGPRVTIGRARTDGARSAPEADPGLVVVDPAASQLHAALVRQTGGSYAVVDLGSTNGTTVNDDPTPIPANEPVPLADGDRVGLGAWTTVTISRCAGAQKSSARTTPAASTFTAS